MIDIWGINERHVLNMIQNLSVGKGHILWKLETDGFVLERLIRRDSVVKS